MEQEKCLDKGPSCWKIRHATKRKSKKRRGKKKNHKGRQEKAPTTSTTIKTFATTLLNGQGRGDHACFGGGGSNAKNGREEKMDIEGHVGGNGSDQELQTGRQAAKEREKSDGGTERKGNQNSQGQATHGKNRVHPPLAKQQQKKKPSRTITRDVTALCRRRPDISGHSRGKGPGPGGKQRKRK